MFEPQEKYVTLYDGKAMGEMINVYGENDFLITYDNKYYFSFHQLKFNHRHQHHYNFHVFQHGNQIFLRADAQGKDAVEAEGQMREIEFAYKYRWSQPIPFETIGF